MEFNDKAVRKGIKVACVDVDVSGSKRHVFVSSDSYEDGKLAGEAVVDSWGSKALKQKFK